ncbi:magnesium-translocating P-type ATPase family protein [Tilletiaria anomala UBC 951]|uniref:Magnesium-transporting ATPase, P-type 1 n=1 Tax=Tilletiaria anomala (strain ATCC 24038 / CBS 436.72 / UBC 951) TaxID=1037660 RepID=A0A066VTV1_TILAU|nr:magnesium-translocating P-type ATPase family protein [Tilletiaria anomala UBC 951]KDN44871.1 magnesium-translocating P-type ATPase family protein [Tilletiaria anomala UBC 951]
MQYSLRPVSQTLQELRTSATGLDARLAADRLKSDGPNQLSNLNKLPWWRMLIDNIFNPFNAILTVLAVIAISTQDYATFTILMLMVVLSVTLRFVQEHKSAKDIYALKALVDNSCLVLGRANADASPHKIDRAQLVVGDVVRISTGSVIPADCLVISSEMLSVSQSTLTGESITLEKYPLPTASSWESNDKSINAIDRPNVLFMGTHVVSGHGDALVIATGDRTYIGTVASVSNEAKTQNDFQRGISQVSMLLLAFMFVMAPTVLIIDGLVTKDWKNAALFCLSVAVGLVPEMLPMVTTANLARGAILIARKKAIIKQLDAVQILGSIDILCSDKTGTLTEDHVSVASSADADGQPLNTALELAYVNAKLQTSDFVNNIDRAILARVEEVRKDGDTLPPSSVILNNKSKVADIPFDFYRRVVSVLFFQPQESEKLTLVCKGAAEEVIRRCTHARAGNEISIINYKVCADLTAEFAKRGERVIGVATRRVDSGQLVNNAATPDLEVDMVLEGFISILDPPKPDAKTAIANMRKLGVTTKVLTGDALPTAQRVCEILDMIPESDGVSDLCITGSDLAQLGPVEFADAVENKCVFAKLTPIQKLEVVRCLRTQGHQVAFLGDGVNDGPALRGSSCGISVNTGCDIAKDAANVILTEKGLDVILDAIIVGRMSFINTLKYIKMAASSNFGNVFSVTVAASWLPFLPMSPTQLLVQNLLYDISQASIPWDNVDEEMILEPVTWSTKSMLKFMVFIGPLSSPFDIFTFIVNWFYFGYQNADNASQVAKFQTHWFLEGCLTQVAIVHVLRTAKLPFLQSRASLMVSVTTFLIAMAAMAFPYIPFLRNALGMAIPEHMFYAFLFPYIFAYIIIVQVAKSTFIKFNKVWL